MEDDDSSLPSAPGERWREKPWRLAAGAAVAGCIIILILGERMESLLKHGRGSVGQQDLQEETWGHRLRLMATDEQIMSESEKNSKLGYPSKALRLKLSELLELVQQEMTRFRSNKSGKLKEVKAGDKGNGELDLEKKHANAEVLKEEISAMEEESTAWRELGDLMKAQTAEIHERLASGKEGLTAAILSEPDGQIGAIEGEESSLGVSERPKEAAALKEASDKLVKVKRALIVTAQNMTEYLQVGEGWGSGEERVDGGCVKAGKGPMYGRSATRSLNWQPEPGRYLLAMCTMGQMSNRIMCFHLYMAFAALLNRTLIVPMADLGSHTKYDMKTVFDIEHARDCVGQTTMLTENEYLRSTKRREIEVKVHCLWPGAPRVAACGFRKGWKQPELKCPLIKLLGPPVAGKLKFNPTEEELLTVYGNLADSVISFGDLLYVGYGNLSYMKALPNGPFKMKDPSCKLIIQAGSDLWAAASAAMRATLGQRYLGLHIRRGDFKTYCQTRGGACFKPLSQYAACIAAKLNALGTSVSTVYAAHNAEKSEMHYLEKAILAQTKRPYAFLTASDLLTRESKKILRRPEVLAAFEKIVAASSRVFLGTVHSTFTLDIFRMRKGLGTGTCLDDVICGKDASELAEALEDYGPETTTGGNFAKGWTAGSSSSSKG